jgi:hypothetical protein
MSSFTGSYLLLVLKSLPPRAVRLLGKRLRSGTVPGTVPDLPAQSGGPGRSDAPPPCWHNPTLPYWYHPDFVRVFRSSVVSFRIRLRLAIRI